MTLPAFTVLLCVNRPPVCLPYAVQSVQRQKREDFELFIVCDGPPRETVEIAQDLARKDKRIRVFDFEKGERNGEAHRHAALQEARGEMVAMIADDDLWFPDHLDEIAGLLDQADFGNLLQVVVTPDGRVTSEFYSLHTDELRRRMMAEKINFFGPTVTGYRLAAYNDLPEGWSPAPEDIFVDLHMWRKFLNQPGLRFDSRFCVTSVQLPASKRADWTPEQRGEEARRWLERISAPEERKAITDEAYLYAATALYHSNSSLYRIERIERDAKRVLRKTAAMIDEGKTVRADTALRTLLNIMPSAEGYRQLAKLFQRTNRPQQAKEAMKQARSLEDAGAGKRSKNADTARD